ncbi:MAG: hypothetical protein RLZ97_1826 [Verrucomicrobiota bacterium]|jgi:hypothetical protein
MNLLHPLRDHLRGLCGSAVRSLRISPALHAILRALVLALITFAFISATSCSLRIGADGSKSFSLDAPAAARALLILSEK